MTKATKLVIAALSPPVRGWGRGVGREAVGGICSGSLIPPTLKPAGNYLFILFRMGEL